MGSSADYRFPLSFYYKIADQMVKQAGVSRKEGNLDDLYLTLNRHARLVSEVIPRHPSYSKCTSKEKTLHAEILHEFAKEVKTLKPILERKDSDFTGQTSSRLREDGSHLIYQRQTENGLALTGYIDGKVNHCSAPRKGHMFTQANTGGASGIAYDTWNSFTQSPFPVAFTAVREHSINVHMVKHMFPSPVLSCTEHPPLVGHVSHFTIPESRNEYLESSCKESSSQSIHDVHISARLMDEFMELARANTDEDLETCGILGASLENQTFYITTLIIPKQESSSNSCQALNEEEIYTIQYDQSLFPAGWIHTHPSQTCFLSSIDLHTQYSYQLMLPEAVAIVMAPTDPTRSYGIFRLTNPGGMTVLKQCQERGFHPHPETADGSPIFQSCSNVYINPNLRFEIIDLR